MPFKKGHKKTGGRKKKALNHLTQEKRDQLSDIWDAGVDDMPEAMQRIKKDQPAVYVKLMLDLASFIVPKKKDITTNDESLITNVTITEHRDKS